MSEEFCSELHVDWRKDDARNGYEFALAQKREVGVRNGTFDPINGKERRQRAEGPVAHWELDCARYPQ